MVIEKAKNKIEKMDGVLKVQKLSNEDILHLIDIESNRTNEVVPIINEGMKECFRQNTSFVIFKKGFFRIPPSPTVILATEEGKILGHEVLNPKDKEKFKNDENVLFLSEDFIVFKRDIENLQNKKSKEYFILPPVDFPELKEIDEITTVVSSSPSTESDEYLKSKYGYLNDSSIASIIVSFSY